LKKHKKNREQTVQWYILIRRAGLAEGYTIPSNQTSARPALRNRIR